MFLKHGQGIFVGQCGPKDLNGNVDPFLSRKEDNSILFSANEVPLPENAAVFYFLRLALISCVCAGNKQAADGR
ncbi:hypothetical protein [Desulforamulus ruminis]|uniref:hypothetical protein n=1 Tax=Desulforamulus ruminis TaxID=1564 RepID=UPI00059B98F6|nr:hypothetical protein [Desulforamulus ruminis]